MGWKEGRLVGERAGRLAGRQGGWPGGRERGGTVGMSVLQYDALESVLDPAL